MLNNEIRDKDKNNNEEKLDIKIKEEINKIENNINNKIENNINYIYYHSKRSIYDLFKIEGSLNFFNILF